MVTIKVTFGSSVHKFNIPAESTWANFESNLRALFKIPDNYKVIASYTDEDNDIITLSSDIELQEVLYHHSNGTNTPVRLVLSAFPTTNKNKEMEETFEKMTITDDEKCCATETETEAERGCDETCEKSSGEKCCDDDDTAQSSSDPEIYFFVRNRSKRRPRFGYARFDSIENSSGKCPFVRGEFDPPHRHQNHHHRQPHGSFGPFGPFGPFDHHGGPRGFHGHPPPPGFMHKKHHGEFEEFGPHREFGHFGPSGPFGPYHGGHARFHGHGGHKPRCNRENVRGKECRKEEKECKEEKERKDEKDTNDSRVESDAHASPCPRLSHRPRYSRSISRSRSRSPHGGRQHGKPPHMRGNWHAHHHSGFHGHHRRHHHGDFHGHHHHHKPITPEELAEKVKLLNSMNFPSDENEHYEELLKKFNGRIGRVVEILLCERKRKDGEEPGDDDNKDDGGNNDDDNDDDNNDFEEIEPSSSTINLI